LIDSGEVIEFVLLAKAARSGSAFVFFKTEKYDNAVRAFLSKAVTPILENVERLSLDRGTKKCRTN
jgi:hypothetical protein